MSVAEEMFRIKITRLEENESKYDFPIYMRLIRKTMGFSRRFVADTIGCSETKLYYLERGKYGTRGPEYEFIITLAGFYGLDGEKILTKFRKYMKKIRANKSQTRECVKTQEPELSGNPGQLEPIDANNP